MASHVDDPTLETPGNYTTTRDATVNVFGSWEDAELVALQAELFLDALNRDDPHRWSIAGYAGVILGLGGRDGYDSLLQAAMENHPDPVESFFIGLRWASLEAKRKTDLELAARIINRACELALNSDLSEPDLHVIHGMTNNFKGLLSIRAKDAGRAQDLVKEAITQFGAEPGATDEIKSDEAVRYAWMARLNQAQLAMFSGSGDADHLLSEVIDFARNLDPGALHTSLSALGYVRLQSGRPVEAIPLLLESLDLLRFEYDLKVVQQVRKMLYRAFVEVGADNSAERVRSDDEYYWRAASNGEKYGYIN